MSRYAAYNPRSRHQRIPINCQSSRKNASEYRESTPQAQGVTVIVLPAPGEDQGPSALTARGGTWPNSLKKQSANPNSQTWRFPRLFYQVMNRMESSMNPKPQLHQHQSRKNPAEIWQQSQADAEQIPECRELLAEIEGLADLVRQRHRLPLLARATRRWLENGSKGDQRGTVTILNKQQVAWPVEPGGYRWNTLLQPGEDDLSRHSAISRWLKEEANCPFSTKTVRHLAWCAIQNEFWLPARGRRRGIYRHEYYHQLLQQLDSTATTRGNLHREAPGVYQCFRPSVIYPGRYVVGLFAVALLADEPRYTPYTTGRSTTAPSLEILRTVELHRIAPDDENDGAALTQGLIQAPGVEEVFTGYMVKKSRQVLVHAFNVITRSFQYTVISDYLLSEPLTSNNSGAPRRERACLQMASGITVGLIGQVGFYSVPTVLLRVGNISLDGVANDDEIIARLRGSRLCETAVGIFPAERIPDFVLRQFKVIGRQVVLRER